MIASPLPLMMAIASATRLAALIQVNSLAA
jgi:hypothetical protein